MSSTLNIIQLRFNFQFDDIFQREEKKETFLFFFDAIAMLFETRLRATTSVYKEKRKKKSQIRTRSDIVDWFDTSSR
jgi:hypothetical protein